MSICSISSSVVVVSSTGIMLKAMAERTESEMAMIVMILDSLACFCALSRSPLLNSPVAMAERTTETMDSGLQQKINVRIAQTRPELKLPLDVGA